MRNRIEFALALSLSLCAPLSGCSAEGPSAPAEATSSSSSALSLDQIEPFDLSPELAAAIDDARDACGCFGDVRALHVPDGTPSNEAFFSDDLLYAILDLDLQLPWSAAGEINRGALSSLISPSLQAQIAAEADPSGGGFRLGAHAWRRMTQPDYCSGESVYLMYFERTGVVLSFRFDTSSEC